MTEQPTTPSLPADERLDTLAAALVSLTNDGIPPDIQELLVRGNPDRGVKPGALYRALRPHPVPSQVEGELLAALKGLRAGNDSIDSPEAHVAWLIGGIDALIKAFSHE